MGYLHLPNLYKDQDILLFRECYALEKIHGTSAHIAFKEGVLRFFAGGCSHDLFVSLFKEDLLEKMRAVGQPTFVVYGEQYGGKQQGMSKRYGKESRFIAFDVKIGDSWLAVPQAEDVAKSLGLEFVHYIKVSTTLETLNAERDAPSEQAKRNGVLGDRPREGVVLRPLIELTKNNGERVIAKHKRAEERETNTQREVTPEAIVVLSEADAIAQEWVTPMRLTHVLDHLKASGVDTSGMECTKAAIGAMVEDVLREGAGEIVDSKQARAAISKATAALMKAQLQAKLQEHAQ